MGQDWDKEPGQRDKDEKPVPTSTGTGKSLSHFLTPLVPPQKNLKTLLKWGFFQPHGTEGQEGQQL